MRDRYDYANSPQRAARAQNKLENLRRGLLSAVAGLVQFEHDS